MDTILLAWEHFMNTYKLILERRSIRRFDQQSIPVTILTKLVNAGRLAPSAGNMQPLEFLIVDDSEQLEKVFGTLKWGRYIAPKRNPPEGKHPVAYIAVLANNDINSPYCHQDAGAAIENMILTAMDDGIGSCWIESLDRENLQKILEIPDNLTIAAVLALGYPDEEPVMDEVSDDGSVKYWLDEEDTLHVPKRDINKITHYNQYSQSPPVDSACDDWSLLMETTFEEEAYLIQGYLQNNGVPCVMESIVFRELPVNVGTMSKVKLLVPVDKLNEGQKLLEECTGEIENPDA